MHSRFFVLNLYFYQGSFVFAFSLHVIKHGRAFRGRHLTRHPLRFHQSKWGRCFDCNIRSNQCIILFFNYMLDVECNKAVEIDTNCACFNGYSSKAVIMFEKCFINGLSILHSLISVCEMERNRFPSEFCNNWGFIYVSHWCHYASTHVHSRGRT